MSYLLRKLSLAFVAVGFSLTFTACETSFGDSCSLPDAQQIKLTCSYADAGGSGSSGTCVYRTAPDCTSQICATHLSSPSFCSETCDADTPCPTGASCLAVADGSGNICVPDKYLDTDI